MPDALEVVTIRQGRLDKNYFVKYMRGQKDRKNPAALTQGMS